jgi:hypothetical protein
MTPFGLPVDLAILFGIVLLVFMVWYASRSDKARE